MGGTEVFPHPRGGILFTIGNQWRGPRRPQKFDGTWCHPRRGQCQTRPPFLVPFYVQTRNQAEGKTGAGWGSGGGKARSSEFFHCFAQQQKNTFLGPNLLMPMCSHSLEVGGGFGDLKTAYVGRGGKPPKHTATNPLTLCGFSQ